VVVSVVRIHLADDHALFREGLASLLASGEGVEVVGTSPTGEEAAERVSLTKPDVIVTQLDMDLRTAEEILEGCSGPHRTRGYWCSPSSTASIF
jgi:DNA-binding NarL/FixJ family response regulator